MGCNNSTDSAVAQQSNAQSICWREDTVTKTLTSVNHNETEVDITHFSKELNPIGVGGFGLVRQVKKLTGPDKGVEYAMKSMSKDTILKRSSGAASVCTELRCLVLLSESPYVCRVYYAFQSPSHLFMVLELARGGDIRHCLRSTQRSRFSEAAARHIICQVLVALTHCHRLSILHRDVKPENLLMTDTGVVKLSDFGVAKILPDVEDCRSTSGTHGYMAPEVYMGAHQHGTASEWFAAGVTLHELLTGRRPFEASRLQAFRYCRALPADLVYSEPHQYAYCDAGSRALSDQSSPAAQSQTQLADMLWPEYLFSQQCPHLSQNCRNFVRGLLIPDATARHGGGCGGGGGRGLAAMQQHPWLRDFDWSRWDTGVQPLPPNSPLVSEFPTAPPLAAVRQATTGAGSARLSSSRLGGSGLFMLRMAPSHAGAASDARQPGGCAAATPAGPAGPGGLENRDELRRALYAHIQAPPVSPEQQHLFRSYAYRNRLQEQSAASSTGSPVPSPGPPPPPARDDLTLGPGRLRAAYVSPLQAAQQHIRFKSSKSSKSSKTRSRSMRRGGADGQEGSGDGGQEEWKEGEDVIAVLAGGGSACMRDPYHVFSPL